MYKTALTYDDIQLVPSLSSVSSRKLINLETKVSRNYKLCVPLVAAPMDTVCESEMAYSLYRLGGVGCIHRFMTIQDQAHQVKTVSNEIKASFETSHNIWERSLIKSNEVPVMAAVGANGDFLERAIELVKAGANVILIDVAHGHHTNVRDSIAKLKESLPFYVDVIAGNIATAEAADDLIDWGADGLRVGVGGGSLCTTRVKTGFGVPNVTGIEDIVKFSKGIPVIADGGIRTSGDIAKALALGADCVMLGSLIAGTKEAPGQIIEKPSGLFKRYRGAASLETKTVHGQEQRNVEGESTVIPFKGGVKFIVEGLLDGVKSALSYGGANNLKEFRPSIVRVTNAGLSEAKPHLIY